jgi:hypothetical protein
MPGKAPLIAYACFALSCTRAVAETGQDDLNTHIWVDTPQGRFECTRNETTNSLEVLTLDGHVVYQEKPSPTGIEESGTLASGIIQYNVGCPWIVADRQGFLVLSRDDAPPAYGLRGYLIIDFNRADLPIVVLGEGFRPEDDAIPEKRRLSWSASGVKLRYFGYTLAAPGGSRNSPKPRAREVYYDFKRGVAEQRK